MKTKSKLEIESVSSENKEKLYGNSKSDCKITVSVSDGKKIRDSIMKQNSNALDAYVKMLQNIDKYNIEREQIDPDKIKDMVKQKTQMAKVAKENLLNTINKKINIDMYNISGTIKLKKDNSYINMGCKIVSINPQNKRIYFTVKKVKGINSIGIENLCIGVDIEKPKRPPPISSHAVMSNKSEKDKVSAIHVKSDNRPERSPSLTTVPSKNDINVPVSRFVSDDDDFLKPVNNGSKHNKHLPPATVNNNRQLSQQYQPPTPQTIPTTNKLPTPQTTTNTNKPSTPQTITNTNKPPTPQIITNTNKTSMPQTITNTNKPSTPQTITNTNKTSMPQTISTTNKIPSKQFKQQLQYNVPKSLSNLTNTIRGKLASTARNLSETLQS